MELLPVLDTTRAVIAVLQDESGLEDTQVDDPSGGVVPTSWG